MAENNDFPYELISPSLFLNGSLETVLVYSITLHMIMNECGK